MILFLSPSGNGMVATIAECRPLEYLSIKHLGFIIDGQDDFESEQVTSWAPAYENYHFRGTDGATELSIEQEIAPEFEQFMQDTWPKALQQLKRLCE